MPQILPRYLSFLINGRQQYVFNHMAVTQYVVLCRTVADEKSGLATTCGILQFLSYYLLMAVNKSAIAIINSLFVGLPLSLRMVLPKIVYK